VLDLCSTTCFSSARIDTQSLFHKLFEACSATKMKYIYGITLFDNDIAVPEKQVRLAALLSPSLVYFCVQKPKTKVIVR